ncbi:aKG-HExxH-type peptide beta-hydroxylase [Pseudomonas sp. N040]|uniref:aKG-HExxH-type peptide beta-hydroxylase n=1 Tax=Pseudomonas sp. N040 TaxID=2785325 RepID=UPI0018A28C21|nr:HEXXH motif-containing putative peptide modification protein [Pseudomonas sp. N040]MBF7730096.1 HEXXH motif domain-containing protein [Pseudomonas sp. N040]MBW7013738.1 hypothetical protein [Pseudomonas sp. N040]
MTQFDFHPDASRALSLDRGMHRELGLSLRHVCEASKDAIPFDRIGMTRLTEQLSGSGVVSPAVFARYYELVEAITGDRFDDARRLFDELVRVKPMPQTLQVVTLGDPALGEESERYTRLMNADTSIDLGFLPPAPEVASAFRERLARGMQLLDTALPALAGEIRAIVHQIVIVGSDPAAKFQFDGGSHYQLWGALFLNGNFHPDEIAVAEVLAHESAHSLLFGFCTHEPLVRNADEELFSSPLRVDQRPMDGIYHATYVSARMHWTMSQLTHSDALDARQKARAHAAAEADARNFDAGYGVVAEHAILSDLGRSLMASAKAYMDSVR